MGIGGGGRGGGEWGEQERSDCLNLVFTTDMCI